MPIFTPEELLQYFYNETEPDKTMAINYALQNDWALREKYLVITKAANKLDKSFQSPRKEAVDAILSYAAKKSTFNEVS